MAYILGKHLHTIVATILLWFIGLIAVSLIKGINLGNELKSTSVYVVELDPNVLPGQKIIAESIIKDIDGIVPNSMQVIDKKDASDIMMSALPELNNNVEDLFRDIITFRLNNVSNVEVEAIRSDILDIGGVSGFFHEIDMFNGIGGGIARFRTGLLALTLVLLIAVILVILYALRQAFELKRNNIVAMFLAGSSPKLIMKPYLISAIKRAIKTALIAILILIVNILLINRLLLNGIEISFLQGFAASILVVIVSLSTYYLTTYSTTNNYLKQFKISS